MAETEFEDIRLYHGSLEELNSKDLNRQYKLCDQDFFITDFENLAFFKEKPYEEIKKQVQKRSYDGLINVRSIIKIEYINGIHMRHFGMEGTPIVKKK